MMSRVGQGLRDDNVMSSSDFPFVKKLSCNDMNTLVTFIR